MRTKLTTTLLLIILAKFCLAQRNFIKGKLITLIKKSTDSIYRFISEDTLIITMLYDQSYIDKPHLKLNKINLL